MGFDTLYTTTITGTSTNFSSTVEGPVDGYRAYAETVTTGLQRLINNDVYMETGLATLPAQTAAYTYLWGNLGGSIFNNTVWYYNIGATISISEMESYTDVLYVPIPSVPINCVIKGFGFYVKGNVTVALPSHMPTISLLRRNLGDILYSNISTTITDTTPLIEEYNVVHLVQSPVLSIETNNYYEHCLAITGSEHTAATNVYKAYITVSRV